MWRMYKTTMEWYYEKKQLFKELQLLVRSLNKIDNEPGDCIFGVFKDFVRKLMEWFFTMIDEENNKNQTKQYLLTLKKSKLTRHFGPIYIIFDDCPPYTDAISDIF